VIVPKHSDKPAHPKLKTVHHILQTLRRTLRSLLAEGSPQIICSNKRARSGESRKADKMNKHVLRITFVLVLGALLGGSALANVKSKTVHFNEDVTVGDTLVKKGDYKVTFDDQTNELTISRGKEVVVKTRASLEKNRAAMRFEPTYTTLQEQAGAARLLTGINIAGGRAVLGGANNQTTDGH
jgi:hypothetical protein